jgi:hypothetical protein
MFLKDFILLRPSNSDGLDDIPGLVIKGYSDNFAPVLKHISNLSLSQQYFPTLWKQAAAARTFKRGYDASVNNINPVYIRN